ncbi:MAG: MotA/TolQ/ExbB proton channel family protein [Planctomycetota bacterium]
MGDRLRRARRARLRRRADHPALRRRARRPGLAARALAALESDGAPGLEARLRQGAASARRPSPRPGRGPGGADGRWRRAPRSASSPSRPGSRASSPDSRSSPRSRLLGLLGTVTGIIRTFATIESVGAADPGALSGGISEALYTTAFGLCVAIPIMLLHGVLSGRVDRLLIEAEAEANRFVEGCPASRTEDAS